MNIFKVLLAFFSPLTIFAYNQYTLENVAEHNTPEDCWVVFEDSVYDLTEYLPDHDRFLDIREWCGQDMTEDFITKAGADRDHKDFSYALLEDYNIGALVEEVEEKDPQEDGSIQIAEVQENIVAENSKDSPYNLIIPLVLTLVIYWASYFIFKKKNIVKFNGFWNTILLLTFLIPSFGFGIFMMLRYNFTQLRDIDFDFMYWHVELSVVMGAITISHIIQRLNQYLVQLKK